VVGKFLPQQQVDHLFVRDLVSKVGDEIAPVDQPASIAVYIAHLGVGDSNPSETYVLRVSQTSSIALPPPAETRREPPASGRSRASLNVATGRNVSIMSRRIGHGEGRWPSRLIPLSRLLVDPAERLKQSDASYSNFRERYAQVRRPMLTLGSGMSKEEFRTALRGAEYCR